MDRGELRIDEYGIKPPPAFSVSSERIDGATVVHLEGELDLAASMAIATEVDAAAGRPLVLDLERVTFADSSAVRALVRAHVDVAARGDRLALAAVPPVLLRVLELTQTARLFAMDPDTEAALARVRGGA